MTAAKLSTPLPAADHPLRREALELRYDGPMPSALHSGGDGGRAAAESRFFDRMARETVRALAHARTAGAHVPPPQTPQITALQRSLAVARASGIGWKAQAQG